MLPLFTQPPLLKKNKKTSFWKRWRWVINNSSDRTLSLITGKMRAVVTGNWAAIEAYGINCLWENQTARTCTHSQLHKRQAEGRWCQRTQRFCKNATSVVWNIHRKAYHLNYPWVFLSVSKIKTKTSDFSSFTRPISPQRNLPFSDLWRLLPPTIGEDNTMENSLYEVVRTTQLPLHALKWKTVQPWCRALPTIGRLQSCDCDDALNRNGGQDVKSVMGDIQESPYCAGSEIVTKRENQNFSQTWSFCDEEGQFFSWTERLACCQGSR